MMTSRRASLTILSLLIALSCGGCSFWRSHPQLEVQSLKVKSAFRQKFAIAYVARGPGADFHVLLLQDGSAKTPAAIPGQPLPALSMATVRQVVHIHIFWIPMTGSRPDNPSATNAAIDWFLVRAEGDNMLGVTQYEGAGLIGVDVDGDTATIKLRSATLAPTRVDGDINEPLGEMHIAGRFDATNAPGIITDILPQLEKLKTEGTHARIDAARLTQPAVTAAR